MPRQSPVTKETTILYGVLIRIGGYTRPRAYMQFLDGQKLSCSVKSRSLAIALAARLYQSIGVRGTSICDPRDNSLLAFHIEELLPQRDMPRDATRTNDAFKGLAEIVERYYDDLDGEG